ncbi:hypothetical protein D3C84_908130 [compost metagenome]
MGFVVFSQPPVNGFIFVGVADIELLIQHLRERSQIVLDFPGNCIGLSKFGFSRQSNSHGESGFLSARQEARSSRSNQFVNAPVFASRCLT